MKQPFLWATIATLSIPAANADPKLYIDAFVTTDYVDYQSDITAPDLNVQAAKADDDRIELNSHSSHIGFKGSEAITDNTEVIYQLEYGVDISGDDDTLQSRDTYLGLDNKDFGQLRVGRNYSVTDYINNVSRNEGYWDNIGSSSVSDDNIANALTLTDGSRINNSIVWLAPEYRNLSLALQYGADESLSDSDDHKDGFGASLMFDQGSGVTAGLAYDKDMSLDGDIIRGTASLDLTDRIAYPVTIAMLYQQVDYEGTSTDEGMTGGETEKGWIISAEMALDHFARPAAIYAQYDTTDNVGGEDIDSSQVVVGGRYEYRSNIVAHAYAGINSADRGDMDTDVVAIGGGLEYLF